MFGSSLMFPVHRVHVVQADDSSSCLGYVAGLRHALVVELVPVRVHLRHLALLLLDQLQADRGRQALGLVDFITVPTVDAPRFEVHEEVIVAPPVERPLSAVYHAR